MKKTSFCWFMALLLFMQPVFSQIKWSDSLLMGDDVEWSNYSTSWSSYDDSAHDPIIVTAIPYNGMYNNMEDMNTPLDFSSESAFYRLRSALIDRNRKLYTYDSSEVYFLTPGIYKENAGEYEYRVVADGRTVIKDWGIVTRFSDTKLGAFDKGFGLLGGYKTGWDKFIVVELRKKGIDTGFATATVYWKEIKPAVHSIYTSKNLNDFFTSLTRPWDKSLGPGVPVTNPVFSSADDNIVYCVSAEIFKKEALEYRLLKDGQVVRDWKPNEYDNGFIWLKDLKAGKYRLEIRFSKQRHMVSDYGFEIRPQWHETTTFKFTAGSLIAAFFGFILVSFRLQKERTDKAMLHLELQSIHSQLNPHFIFNSLNSIQGLINKNDTAAANTYLSEFGNLLRQSLTLGKKDLTTLDHELVTLEKYVKLEQLRFGFRYEVQIDEAIHQTETVIPSLLLQPLLENAVKHGVAGMQEKGIISLEFQKEHHDMLAIISDNGKGFIANENTGGFGLRLTHERIRLLNGTLENRSIALLLPTELGAPAIVRFKNWLT